MSNTSNLGLAMVQASQAQKHVTVNEAFARLDGLVHLTLMSTTETLPPVAMVDGSAYAVPPGAGGDWTTQTGKIAIASNGGWVFVAPRTGWRAWIGDEGRSAIFDGAAWVEGAVSVSPGGAASCFEVIEIDVALPAGSSVATPAIIPAFSVVMGVSGIVTERLDGSLSSWRLGIDGAPQQYGSGLGVSLGSWVQGLSGQPQAFYAETPLIIGAEGGDFSGGAVRLAVHVFRMTLPRP